MTKIKTAGLPSANVLIAAVPLTKMMIAALYRCNSCNSPNATAMGLLELTANPVRWIMAREKHVYPTDSIAHLWAHQTQQSAHNPQHNLYFDGDTIYSYRDSYPIGRLVTMGKGQHERKAVLLQENHYSNTTAKHCSLARRATSHMTQFTVPCLTPSYGINEFIHTANLAWYAEQVAIKVAEAQKARQYAISKYRSAKSQWDESVQYAAFFKQRKPVSPVDWTTLQAECIARATRAQQLSSDPTLKPKRAAARMKREAARDARRQAWIAEQTAKIADSVAKWRTGEINTLPYFDRPPNGLYSRRGRWNVYIPGIPTMLRIKGNEVETSQGDSFPVSHAKRGLALARAVMARGEDWQANDHTCKLGHYAIQRITADGTVTAGCHVVTWPEIERIAPELDAYHVTGTSETL